MTKTIIWSLKEYTNGGSLKTQLDITHLVCENKADCLNLMYELEDKLGNKQPDYNRENERGIWFGCYRSKEETRSKYTYRYYSITHNQNVIVTPRCT